MRCQRLTGNWLERLAGTGVPCSPVASVAERRPARFVLLAVVSHYRRRKAPLANRLTLRSVLCPHPLVPGKLKYRPRGGNFGRHIEALKVVTEKADELARIADVGLRIGPSLSRIQQPFVDAVDV